MRRPPRSTLFPSRRSSDLRIARAERRQEGDAGRDRPEPFAIEHVDLTAAAALVRVLVKDRKSTRLNSSHVKISYAVFCLKKKTTTEPATPSRLRPLAPLKL